MKSNLTTTALNGMLAFLLLASVILCVQYVSLTRDFRSLNGQVNGIIGWRNGVQALVADCGEYGKKNSAIIPILENKTAAPSKPAK